ncbi:PepSY domain-containing protein [Parageobacillus genomosp. 1]|uniref:PepSY domain-containing protein n=1 Tax=Parageobacillus genomosp. 1 TaxID=1295642 RepID=UPI000A6EC955|nr:PepSY domain-containing protein [Parageobacillus genomosp. 1]
MSLQQERLDYAKETVAKHEISKAQSLYRAVWRWHFYAGIVFAPFVILLAITGIIYLFI